MKFVLDTNYSAEELNVLESLGCEVLSEIKLSKTNFSEYEYRAGCSGMAALTLLKS